MTPKGFFPDKWKSRSVRPDDASGVLREPDVIRVGGRALNIVDGDAGDNRDFDQRGDPFVSLHMAVGERESTGAVMICGGHIRPKAGCHLEPEKPVIDAASVFIAKYPCITR